MSPTPVPETPATPLLELIGINKRYGEVQANRNLSLALFPGEVHALLGENGAGKSTLTRILYGLSRPDSGVIRAEGTPVRFGTPAEAMAAGIGLVTQEFSLVHTMTVAENVILSGAPLGRIDLNRARTLVRALGDRLELALEPDRLVDSLSVGEQQRLEIMKALVHDSRVLVLDEPTAVLTPQDVRALFGILGQLVAEGLSVLLISHKLHEVAEIADRVSILRHGEVLTTVPAAGMRAEELARLMVGAE
ncbi:ATP-binding cassette domain-containing protein, partial [Leucobacter sp. M11]|uniref:ATP-binding cassette domain-containing protein n=1 Tax=Leucobacter sp. M11 TaxID=2993565 RepID=UPI002D8027DB